MPIPTSSARVQNVMVIEGVLNRNAFATGAGAGFSAEALRACAACGVSLHRRRSTSGRCAIEQHRPEAAQRSRIAPEACAGSMRGNRRERDTRAAPTSRGQVDRSSRSRRRRIRIQECAARHRSAPYTLVDNEGRNGEIRFLELASRGRGVAVTSPNSSWNYQVLPGH